LKNISISKTAMEVNLIIQGIGSLSGIYVGLMPEALAIAGLVMVCGLLFLCVSVCFLSEHHPDKISC
jgi:hypothetical protein